MIEASKRAVHALDRSWLVIQGPPGAGKTYTTSHLIVSLIRAGKTVGVASNSHKAIDNVLNAIEKHLIENGESVRLLGQKKDSGGEGYTGSGFIESVTGNDEIDATVPIIAGTAWAFARPELAASRDVLFVDEAGQVSLGNLVAMAAFCQIDCPRGRPDATRATDPGRAPSRQWSLCPRPPARRPRRRAAGTRNFPVQDLAHAPGPLRVRLRCRV